eukprot:Colp12_sorted_trinity150504_noHs@1542
MVFANRNEEFLHEKGFWVVYVLGIGFFRLILGFVPFLTNSTAWSATNIIHNLATLGVFHFIKGTPFGAEDQGKYNRLTLWEQLDEGKQFTSTRKFFTLVPIILFLVTIQHLNSFTSFTLNFLSLAAVLIAKLPQMHRVRIFGLMKY